MKTYESVILIDLAKFNYNLTFELFIFEPKTIRCFQR